jgi:hypothetical protein
LDTLNWQESQRPGREAWPYPDRLSGISAGPPGVLRNGNLARAGYSGTLADAGQLPRVLLESLLPRPIW